MHNLITRHLANLLREALPATTTVDVKEQLTSPNVISVMAPSSSRCSTVATDFLLPNEVLTLYLSKPLQERIAADERFISFVQKLLNNLDDSSQDETSPRTVEINQQSIFR